MRGGPSMRDLEKYRAPEFRTPSGYRRGMEPRGLAEDEIALPGDGYAAIDDFDRPLTRGEALKARPSVSPYLLEGETDEESDPDEYEPDADADDAPFMPGAVDTLFNDFAAADTRNGVRSLLGTGRSNPTSPLETATFEEELRRQEAARSAMMEQARQAERRRLAMRTPEDRDVESMHAIEAQYGRHSPGIDTIDDFTEQVPAYGDQSTKMMDRLREEIPDDDEYARLREHALLRLRRPGYGAE